MVARFVDMCKHLRMDISTFLTKKAARLGGFVSYFPLKGASEGCPPRSFCMVRGTASREFFQSAPA